MNSKNTSLILVIGTFLMSLMILTAEASAIRNGKIAFVSDRDGNAEIYVMNADGSNQTRLTNNGSNDDEPAFSPDATKIAFTSDRDGHLEIYVMNADGTNQRRVTFDNQGSFAPAWLSDGGKLAYIANSVEINTINLDGSGRRTIYTVPDQANNFLDRTDFLRDGAKAVFELYSEFGFASDIVTMNADGSGVTQITSALFFEFNSRPAWSPDGTRIVFSHNIYSIFDGDVLSLDIANADGGSRQTIYGGTSFNPDWSPDGTKITFDDATFVNPATDIYVMNQDGSATVNLTNSGAKDYDPSWGPVPHTVLYNFDTDMRADLAVFRPSNDRWYIRRANGGYSVMEYGVGDDLMVPADYDGDGKADIAMFRPSTGTWYIFNSSDQSFQTYNWGVDGDLPVPADHNADGKADLVLFRQSNGMFYRRMSDNSFSNVSFGVAGDKPVIGDFDKDGQFDIGVYRPSNNNWYIRKSTAGFFVQTWGEAGDIPVPADYDGDGQTDLAVWRSSNGRWYRAQSTVGFDGVNWGVAGDKPIPADYDGDGKADVAIFRPSNGSWYMIGTTIGQLVQQFGQDGDVPAPSAFIY